MTNYMRVIKKYIVPVIGLLVFCVGLFYPLDLQAVENVYESKQDLNKRSQTGNAREQKWNITDRDLSLQYDDRYSLAVYGEDWAIASIETKEVYSYKVSSGNVSHELDSEVVLQDGKTGTDIIASGTGRAEILLVPQENLETAKAVLSGESEKVDSSEPIEALRINITVKPAKLTLMYVAGQSNAEGLCSKNTGYRLDESVACKEGTVYSTYAPTNSRSTSVTGISFPNYCTKNNSEDFVAGSLTEDKSISGKRLNYPLDALTTDGL